MGRPRKGWTLRRRTPDGPWSVRFRDESGRDVERGTGETDQQAASRVAARIYSAEQRRSRAVARRAPKDRSGLAKVASEWLTRCSDLDASTRGTYALYASTHWCAHWSGLHEITEATARDYVRARLAVVQGATVRKEVSALRKMLAWAVDAGKLGDAPELPSIGKKVVGKRHKQARKGSVVEVTPAEMQRIIGALPVKGRRDYPIRARYRFAYETGLRTESINRLRVPEHWSPGRQTLTITAEIDKARAGRELPLSRAAIKALTSAAPAKGLVFGPADLRVSLQRAACKVLGDERGERFTERYCRHNRFTHWAETSDNLAGLMYLAGHSNPATTARYIRPSMRAARDVLGE